MYFIHRVEQRYHIYDCKSLRCFIFERHDLERYSLTDAVSDQNQHVVHSVDITPLGECIALEQLVLTRTRIVGFDSIGRCTSLESLMLHGTDIRRDELVALQACHKLKELILEKVLSIDSIEFVEEMPDFAVRYENKQYQEILFSLVSLLYSLSVTLFCSENKNCNLCENVLFYHFRIVRCLNIVVDIRITFYSGIEPMNNIVRR